MQFETLDATMRVFETAHDHAVLPGLWMVARLDGRNFTRLVREVHTEEYEKPAINPKTGAAVTARRRRLALIEELPAREAFSIWVEQPLSTIEARHGTD